jgi:APA family basic amino acid/polyamine antiporter
LLKDFGLTLPAAFVHGPFDPVHGLINVPAIVIVVMLSLLLMRGMRESAAVNGLIVVIKVTIVVVFIAVGAFFIHADNYRPFIPPNAGTFGEFGWSGIMRGAGVIFFAYIGFDAVSTAAQETHQPQRTMPIGIIGSPVICTILYVAFAVVLTGMVNYRAMHGDAAPVATAIDLTPFPGSR